MLLLLSRGLASAFLLQACNFPYLFLQFEYFLVTHLSCSLWYLVHFNSFLNPLWSLTRFSISLAPIQVATTPVVTWTHSDLFSDTSKVKPGCIDFASLRSSGVWILRPDYIAEYLTQDPPPPTLKYVISDAQQPMDSPAQTLQSDSKKRKNDDDRLSQRTKRSKK